MVHCEILDGSFVKKRYEVRIHVALKSAKRSVVNIVQKSIVHSGHAASIVRRYRVVRASFLQVPYAL